MIGGETIMTYLYESHLGGLYASDDELDYDQLYCEACGDSDDYLGEFETIEELKELLKDTFYSREYIDEFIEEEMHNEL